MNPHNINKSNNFISGWYIDEKICDDIVSHYSKTISQEQDNTRGYSFIAAKDFDQTYYNNYCEEMLKAFSLYKQQYHYCNYDQNLYGLMTSPKIKRYKQGNSYSAYHYENTGHGATWHRHITFMTYLNDVSSGGETEFLYQNIKIKPEAGLTLFWPAQWTHTHKGHPANNDEKFIITGWFSYNVYDWKF